MALDPKLIIVGAAIALLLGGKKSGKAASGTSDKKDISEEDKSDKGDPVGPNGCKTGLVEKDGYCVDPKDPNDQTNGTKGNTNGGKGNGNNAAKSELTIAKDCKSWSYGDKSGDAWWKAKGESKAKQWIKAGYLNPLDISFEMLKTSGNCFKDFPIREDFQNGYDYNLAKFEWINDNRSIWFLLYSVRNKVDLTQFNGIETVQTGPDLKYKYGKNFDYDKFWESIKPLALALLQLSYTYDDPELGPIGQSLGILPPKTENEAEAISDSFNRQVYIPTYIFSIIFPNIPVNEWLVKMKKGVLSKDPFWLQIQSSLNAYDGEELQVDDFG